MAAPKSKKRVVAPVAKSRKIASRRKVSTTSTRSASVHPLHKHYFLEEQEEFLNKHPLVRIAITIFIMTVVFFLIVVFLSRDALLMM